MDYHSLKRKELQALCKEHGIPANSANSVLADKLSALLNEKQKPKGRTCMKSSVETRDEGEPAESKRQSKKVRFSPNNDLLEYELRSGEKQKDMVTQVKTRRKSVAKKVDEPVVDNNITIELVEDTAQIPVRVTRSKVQSSVKDVPNNEKKKGRREAKGGGVQREDTKKSKKLIKEVEEATDTVEETVVGRVRATRSKAQTSMEGGTGCGANAHVKKKTVKQVKTDGHNVEPPKEEIIDVPVRATRSARQTLKEDIGNTVTNPQDNKKRTRREMKSTDLDSNSSHVAAVDKQEPPNRKSLRTRGVVKDEGDKMEVVNASRATRNSKNKAIKVEVQELEEPFKHPSKKNVTRRKSVLQPDKTEDDPHLEEAVNQPTRRNTRRKSVVQKATMKIESSTGTPKSGKDKENDTTSGKDASVNDFKEVTTGTPKSRKRRGTPIIEDQVMETEYGSPVDKSPKGSTRSAIKSERKSVAKKEVDSSLKKPKSRMNIQSSIEKTSLEGKSSARSGAIIKESSSKKRAKLSRTKQSDSEDHAVNSSKEWTPVAKLRNLKLDEEVTDPEVSPAIDKSDRQISRSTIKSEIKEPGQSARFTRSTIKSERKEPSQSAIKEQPTAVQLFSPKVAKLRSDPAVNTAPGRITRRGIKHDGNAAGSFSEKVGKKKQTRQSALKKPHDDAQMLPSPEVAEAGPSLDVGTIVQAEVKQSLDEVQKSSPEDAEGRPHLGVDTLGVQSENKQPYDKNVQMCSPEAAEVQPNPDGDTAGVGSESSIEVTGQILGDVSASGSARLPTKTVEENRVSVSETAIDLESTSLVSGENASVEAMEDAGACIEKSTHEANATQCVTENLLSGKDQNPPELQNFDAGTPLVKNLSHIKMTSVTTADDAETLPDAVSDISRVVHVETGIFNAQENPSSGDDVYVERDDAISDRKFHLDMFGTPLMGKGGVQDDGSSLAEELETGSELSNAKNILDVPVSGIDFTIERVIEDNSDVHNGESEHDQLTSIVNHATDKEYVRGDDSELAKNEEIPGAAEVLVRSHDEELEQSLNVAVDDVPRDTVGESDSVTSKDTPKTLSSGGIDDVVVRVDAPEVLVVDINKDAVSSILGDTYDMDAEGDSGNEQKLTEGDDRFQPNESGIVSYDTSNEQTKEEAGTHRGYGHTLDDPEQAAPTHDDPDNGKIMEGSSHIGVKEAEPELLGNINVPEDLATEEASPILNTDGEPTVDGIDSSQVMGDIGACESLITKESSPITYKNIESPVDDTDSVLTIKEDDRNKQEETRNASTFVDWGDYDFGMDEFEKPVSANGSSDMEGEDKKDDQDSNLQTSERTSYTREESSGLAAGLANSARKFDKDSGNAADVKSNLEDDMLKDSATATDTSEEVFNWSDSSLKSVSATPATTRIGHVRESLEEEVKFANQDTYSSLKSLFVTPATTQISNVKTGQEEAVDLPNQDHYSSLKPFFKTPTTQISHAQDGRDVKIGQEDAVNFGNQDHYSSLKPLFKTPAAQISHVQDGRDVKTGQEDAAIFGNQDHYSSLKPLFKTPATQISHVQDVRDVKTGQEDAVNFPNQDHYSSLKPLFKTPSTQISHLQDGRDVKTTQEDAADFGNQDHYSSLKPLFKTPVVTQTSHVKGGHEDAVDFANQDHYSSLKPLFKTPAVTQTSHVKGVQDDAVRYANHDPYSSLKPLFTTPVATQISHVKDAQGEATNFANKDHYSSLKSLFATPATSIISHVTDRKTDAVNFTHSDGRCNENTGSSRTASHEFNHQWGNDQSKDLNGETQGNAVRGPQNDVHGVSSFEDYPQKLFENEVSGSIDNSGSNTQFEFKQFDFLNEAAGASHHNPSGLEDNSTCSSEFEKKEDNLMKGSEVNDDLGFGTGHMHDYRGNSQYSNK